MADDVLLPVTGTGTANITQATQDISSKHYPKIVGAAADGAAVVGNPVLVAGQDGTNVQSLKTNSSGQAEVMVQGHTQSTAATASWTSATGADTVVSLSVSQYASATLAFTVTPTISVGVVSFEGSSDGGTTWKALYGSRGVEPNNNSQPYLAVSSIDLAVQSDGMYFFGVGGLTNIRIRLSTAITGGGSVDLRLVADTAAPAFVLTSDPRGKLGVSTPVVGFAEHDVTVASAPVAIGGHASAAAPTDVSSDGDAVKAWYLRNGAAAVALTAAGALIPGDATSGLRVANAGTVAHDASTANNPVTTGSRAIEHGANPTAVASGDVTNNYANRAGVPFVMGGHPNIITTRHTVITTAVTDAAIITVGSGTKIVVTAITVTLDNASTVFPSVLIGFGLTNTPTVSGVILSHGGVPAGGGINRGDGSGILGIGGDGVDLRVTTVGNATGNGLHIVVTYYTIES